MKTKWIVRYWDNDKDCEAKKGFYSYEDAITWAMKNKTKHNVFPPELRKKG